MKSIYTIKTRIRKRYINHKLQDCIEQDVQLKFNKVISHVSKTISNTQEKQFIDTLVKLGWTPPKNN